jgi:membrane-bound ClpP family serine protease
LIAVIASAFVAGFLWVAARKSVEAAGAKPLHDLDALVGRTGEARTKIEEEGSVLVAGELWSAKSDNAIAAGSPVRVVRRDGFVLVVEKNG